MEWILVIDKMPPEGERVEVVVIDKPYRGEHMVMIGCVFSNENVPSGFQLDDDTVEDMLRDDRQIIAWRHLPDVPDSLFDTIVPNI